VPLTDEIEVLPADMVLLAIGFEGVEHMRLLEDLDISLTQRGTISCGSDWQTTAPGVFVCGDAHRGASLVVWAIAEGRSVANAVDSFLTGSSNLPSPVIPNQLPLAVV
jgi:glutamate synthase (NADPH) small chain